MPVEELTPEAFVLPLTQALQVVDHIEAGNILPPVVVLQTLSRNPAITMGHVRGYISRQVIMGDGSVIHGLTWGSAYMAEVTPNIIRVCLIQQGSMCSLCTHLQLTRETQDLSKGREQVAKLANETANLQAEAHRLRTQV